MQRLTPIIHRDAYTRAVESEINAYFEEVLIAPIENILKAHHLDISRENSPVDTLADALKKGRLWYSSGTFFGKINAALSSALRNVGATMNKHGNFTLPSDKLPIWIRGAVEQSRERASKLHQHIVETLLIIAANLSITTKTGIETAAAIPAIIGNLEQQFIDATKPLDITGPDLTPAAADHIRIDYTENINLSVKNFLKEEVLKLREIVQQNATAGHSTATLADQIETRFGVTKRKAAFLADQETSLLTAKFRQHRYSEIGVRDYVWQTCHDERVRPDHRLLDGKRFSFDSPPITNRATGARNNPGEDFRCRCVPIPVIEGKE